MNLLLYCVGKIEKDVLLNRSMTVDHLESVITGLVCSSRG